MMPEEVGGREELAAFIKHLIVEIHESPELVSNATLAGFLSGASGWVEDLEGYFTNRGEQVPEQPTWSLVASIFAAATVYE